VGRKADLDGSENFAPIGIRSPDHPSLSESLYRLSYLINKTFVTRGLLEVLDLTLFDLIYGHFSGGAEGNHKICECGHSNVGSQEHDATVC
jgi:hypothetical protein